DVAGDGRWAAEWRQLALGHGLRTCYSAPIFAADGAVLGSFAMYYREPRDPRPANARLVETATHLAGIAIARARAEAERARLLAREQAARARAEDAVRARDEFLATVSHDLKSPLSTVKGYAQLLRMRARREVTPEIMAGVADGAAKIEATADKMTALIGELLDVARLEAGESLDLERAPTDLVALAAEAIAGHRQAGADRRFDLLAPDAPLTGTWDRARLERALNNLLGNAVKYSPDGGPITMSVRQERDDAGAWAVLAVRDEGIGIPAAELPRVFERYRRASNAAGRIAGTGLGLASARHIVESHGGALTVESREGRGSTFTMRLPLTSDE
ncbi:MAG TPA: ATP-binding protein, partial [Thermomicrobiales bacterium]|nr:ATP-binding protein [Thermomicrobiales bacterium]